jgi:uncharacterized protein with GYD domain
MRVRKEILMPLYLLQVAYTSEGWASLLKSPQNRLDAVRPAVEKLGGKIETGWFCFGDYDLVSILQMPDNVSAKNQVGRVARRAGAADGCFATVVSGPHAMSMRCLTCVVRE